MSRFAAIAVLFALLFVSGAQSADYIHYPDSEEPVFIADGLIRFQTNLGTAARVWEPYIVAADGSGLRPGTAEEAAAPVAAPATSARLELADPFRTTTLRMVDGGRSRLVESAVWGQGGAALSPDGKTVVFAEWVGWAYSDGSTLYAVAADGSSEPRRLTPTSCTLTTSTHSALSGRCLDGTDGADRLVGLKGGDVIIAGSGADTIRAGDGTNIIQAQWGDDDVRSGSGPDWIWAGDGNDTIRSGAGSDRVDPGPGRDTVAAGSGVDYVYANDGQRDVIDCGPGDDRARVDRIDVVRSCEHVYPAPATSLPAWYE
ncbi:MAG: calcium-binding protein [Gaiellaceae bacterium]